MVVKKNAPIFTARGSKDQFKDVRSNALCGERAPGKTKDTLLLRTVLGICLCVVCWYGTEAQEFPLSNLRLRTIPLQAGWIELDTLAVLEPTVEVRTAAGRLIDRSQYELAFRQIRFSDSLLNSGPTEVRIRYRVLPPVLTDVVSRIDTSELQRDPTATADPFLYNPYDEEDARLDFGTLDYSGNFSRGISFGNSQSLVLNSSFNLQMAGEIGDGIELLAAITDENIPIQPEGNTQQLNEFDKIFIQLKKGNGKLIAGDYELGRPNSYFTNYFKKLQGATYEQGFQLANGARMDTRASIAVARGKFARNLIQGQESNQGPYRLEGAEGERFLIVLAGTEKVFVDGQLMKRGLEEDYVIDYNRGDVTFTNRRLITKDSRIIVEFEYSDQNYLRSLYTLHNEYRSDRLRLYLNLYTEQDGRSTVGEEELSAEERDALSLAGDDPLAAVTSSLRPADESVDPITYRLVDTLVGGVAYDSVLVFSPATDGEAGLVVARFSNVGEGNGNYIRPASDANGVVYVWVAPDPVLGPQGAYEPVIQLIAPKQLQLHTMGMEYRLSETASIQTELALSKLDRNRFSRLDSGDDYGLASYTQYRQDWKLGSRWELQSNLQYEYAQEHFNPLNPYRNPEFARDWNLSGAERATEHLGKGGFSLNNDSLGMTASYQFNGLWRADAYEGRRQLGQWTLRRAGWDLDLQADYLRAEGPGGRSDFFRPKARLSKTFDALAGWELGVYGEREKNRLRALETDTLQTGSFYYDLWRVFVESPQKAGLQFGASFSQRLDYRPADERFDEITDARELNVKGAWQAGQASNLGWDLTYRQLRVPDTTLANQQPADTYLGRIDYGLTLWKGALRYSNSYQIGSGQEQKLLFVYRKVLTGQGLYQHIDFNGDGQEQNNEFVIAPTPDQGTHERVVIYTNEFVRTNNVLFNQSLRLDPRAVWFTKTGLRKFLARFSTVSSWQISRNLRDLEGVSPWNPFELEVTDTALVSTRTFVQNTLFFNRVDPKFGLEAGWSDNQNKVLLTTGLESRRNFEPSLRGRWNITRTFSLQAQAGRGFRLNDSENFTDRSYRIEYSRIEPKLSWLPTTSFGTTLSYRYERAENTLMPDGETGIFHDLKIESSWNQAGKSSLRGSFSLVRVRFDGEPNSAVGFAFLNGLQNGRNFLWNLELNRQLAPNVRLNLTYEGRKTGTADVVHVGRAQVAATF